MFRLDPNGTHSVDDIIATLREVLTGVPPDSPRAQKLAEMIRGLRKSGKGEAESAIASRAEAPE
jgi:hypothetical protein